MLKGKKKFFILVMVMILLVAMAGTAMAASYYKNFFTWSSLTNNSVGLVNSIQDNNSYARYGYSNYSAKYQSSAYYSNMQTPNWTWYNSTLTYSGNRIWHSWSGPVSWGKLRFCNYAHPSYSVRVSGTIS